MSWFIIGLILLIIGAKLLVYGASSIGALLRLSPLIIGLTIIAFGTSSPEIAVCALAAARGEGDIVVGNIAGSNIFNLLFVLGFVSLATPVVVRKRLIYWDVPIMIFAALLFWAFSSFGVINRPEGFLLFFGFICYTFFAFRTLKEEEILKPKPVKGRLWLHILWVVVGLLLLSFGSDWLIRGVEKIASHWKVSSLFLSLTLVAVGTSLPEIATTIVCLLKKEGEMALGTLVGSNIFNVFAVGGVASIVKPIAISSQALHFDIPVMFATGVAALPIAITGHKISRWEGVLFLIYYAFYVTYISLAAIKAPILPLFQTAFFGFILPFTVITLIITLWRHYR